MMRLATLFFALVLPALGAHAQYGPPQPPPPVDLGIQNIPQQTGVWCWAAVAQQIIAASKGLQNTPPQCALVAIASGVPPEQCCNFPQTCQRTGHLLEIQGLIRHFGGRYSQIAPPTDPMSVYNTLRSGRAIILAVQTSPSSGHVVVVRGMAWVPAYSGMPQPVLYINDPMGVFTQPVPFVNLLPIWSAAIVVQ